MPDDVKNTPHVAKVFDVLVKLIMITKIAKLLTLAGHYPKNDMI